MLLWACLAPLLLTVFHGTVFGLTSLGATILFLAGGLPTVGLLLMELNMLGLNNTPISYKLPLADWSGIALWLFCVGECRRFWRKKAISAEATLEKANQRIERFSRNYQLLKASHDQLSQSCTEITPHVRGAVRQLKQLAACTPAPRLRHLGKTVMEIFAEFGAIQCAGLYTCHGDALTLCHQVGVSHSVADQDPMLKAALETGELQYISGQMRSTQSRYQLCIPFVDSTGKTHAVIAAESIRFFALNADHLTLLAVLAHVCADLLNDELLATVLEEHQEHLFRQKIKAYKSRAQQNFMKVCVVTLETTSATQGHLLRELVGVFRDTDTLWFHQEPTTHDANTASDTNNTTDIAEQQLLTVLMPMTNAEEAHLAVERIISHLQVKTNNPATGINIRTLKTL